MGIALYAAGKRVAAIETDIRRKADPVEVVVASVPIPAGEEFMPANIAKKSVPASGTGKRNVPAGDYELLLGSKAKSQIDPGEPVLWTDVEEPFEADAFSKTVPKGRRALTVSVDTTSSFSGLLQPGDRVDLLAKGRENKGDEWIRNVPVIAVDRNYNRLARPTDTPEAGTVTLM
ncbi:MAG: Flp pilus assembly protein CpaB, partial [Deltaproteobacteria bacterium]|nr:Flp pilus assembly protein CpaB [Deltaproteobacteria bacterium]